ncbi:MAG: energy transducer TonB [Tannerellaceae bacterium]|nr:energy transducer TonB [Tannerellaceae bacterium]
MIGILCVFSLSATHKKGIDSIKSAWQEGDKVYQVVDGMPRYPGGENEMLKYIATNTIYPETAKNAGEQGRVVISYTVEKDGSISDIQVVRGISEDLNQEAIRLVKEMPTWEPGTNKGEIVRVRYTLPIIFRLQ